MPKVEQFDKHIALQEATNVFWQKGYKGTSLTDLTLALGIGKGSFYNTFKSKSVLFEQCINAYRCDSIKSLKEILQAEKNAKKGLRNFLKATLDYAVNDPEHKGCFLTNTCTELAASNECIAQLMNDHYKEMKLTISIYLKNASSLKNLTITQVANTIVTFFIGMTVEVKLQNNKKQIEQSIHHLLQSLF